MKILYYLNKKLWRRLLPSNRRKIMGLLEHSLPRSLFQKVLASTGSGIFRQEVLSTGVLFIHIPKAAGTAVIKSLYGLGGIGHYRAVDAQAQNSKQFYNTYRFAVTRNPWERLLSSYTFIKAGGTTDVPFYKGRNRIAQFPNTFEKFVLDWLVHQEPERVNGMFMPQYLFVCDMNGKLLVDDIFEMKNMSPLESELSKRLGRSVNIQQTNITGSESSLAEAYSNVKVVEAVAQFYRRDIELFGYEYPLEIPHM